MVHFGMLQSSPATLDDLRKPGYIDEVISPADTRAVICRSLDILASKREDLPRRKHGNVPL